MGATWVLQLRKKYIQKNARDLKSLAAFALLRQLLNDLSQKLTAFGGEFFIFGRIISERSNELPDYIGLFFTQPCG